MKMLGFLDPLKSLIRLDKVRTDNNVCKLHYRWTVVILVVSSLLVSSKQYFGDPIKCDVGDEKTIEVYCWIYGTFTLKKQLNHGFMKGLGTYVDEHDSRNPVDRTMNLRNDDEIISQKYYQWVSLTLLVQALLFYLPRYLWKTWEGDRMKILVRDYGSPIVPPSWSSESRDRMVSYMLCGKYDHNLYYLRFIVCEILNMANVVLQIIATNYLLNGRFLYYGYNLIANTNAGYSTMVEVFPKLTKCTYFKYGSSGSMESRDALCVLPLNVVNEKLYAFLWLWFYLLTILSAYNLVQRAVMLASKCFRVYVLMAQTRYTSLNICRMVVDRLSFGDHFVLCQLAKNLNPIIFKDLVVAMGNVLLERTTLPYNPEASMTI